ncbi:hypothetical protein ACFZ8E_06315 [Methylobacterium sp. HMF5984]|uniref:hypothetical protein n=1 Tax=Methylobacterium sp. HMF5984 TaxID=3367370 RepID=UPI0038552075
MRKTLLAAVVWLAVLGPGFAKADPFLTPLLATYVVGEGVITIGTATISYASIASFALTAGVVAHPTILQVAR